MHAYATEVVPEARLHKLACRCGQRLTGCMELVLDDGRCGQLLRAVWLDAFSLQLGLCRLLALATGAAATAGASVLRCRRAGHLRRDPISLLLVTVARQIGRASCRERVEISVVAA